MTACSTMDSDTTVVRLYLDVLVVDSRLASDKKSIDEGVARDSGPIEIEWTGRDSKLQLPCTPNRQSNDVPKLRLIDE